MRGTLCIALLKRLRAIPCRSVALWAIVFSISLLSACERDDPEKAAILFDKPSYEWGKVAGQTITIRGNAPDLERPYMLKAFERYQAMTGNTIKLEGLTSQELEKNLAATFIEGKETKPDILLSPGGALIELLNPEQNFYDFTHAPWVDDLTDTAINQTISNGKVIGLPYWEASIAGTLYNKKIFAQHNIAIPRTQQEFMDVCAKLHEKGITPLYLPFTEASMMLYQFPLDSIFNSSEVLEELNQGALSYADIPAMAYIVRWYKRMADKGYLGSDYARNGWDGMNEAMRSGKYAMMLCWDTWLYTDFTGDPDQFGIMPAFMGIPENGLFEGPNLMLLMVNKNSPRVEAALDLISFMADPYNYNVTLAGTRTAPVFKNQTSSIATPQYVEAERQIEKLFYDSTARLRIKGFSQHDASYIQRHMQNPGYTVTDCLRDMDAARKKRSISSTEPGEQKSAE